MAVHPRVLAFLGRALSLELSAVQQYVTHSALADRWGDRESSGRFRHEAVEEMQHAERLVQRMLSFGVAPAASQLRPVTTAGDLVGLLRQNAALESSLVEHYTEAVRFCLLISDRDNTDFFRQLHQEEFQHGVELEAWLSQLSTLQWPAEERATF
ncbi:ferritin-like domain-containing protein [Cyanobium sp. Morenito 9A2]|uniref:ferritin-like domain-containing protein n=1 Tax=Cyanobium sp. Morenito 9A2 TaxID=2823718 RepID=UPI0028F4097C|nr:ferritin-like domain-containing protein [Cyanobium sp. Morenito 9A2]